MNFGFSGEMIFLFLLALILFGPKKMPEIGRQVARILGEFRRASNEFRSQIESEVNSLELGKANNPQRQMLPSFQAPLGSLASRIFNPPAPEQLAAVEDANQEAATVKAAAEESTRAKDAANVVTLPDPSAGAVPVVREIVRKAAPDA
jgi:TatA/E family protein of Tat protein translocase